MSPSLPLHCEMKKSKQKSLFVVVIVLCLYSIECVHAYFIKICLQKRHSSSCQITERSKIISQAKKINAIKREKENISAVPVTMVNFKQAKCTDNN